MILHSVAFLTSLLSSFFMVSRHNLHFFSRTSGHMLASWNKSYIKQGRLTIFPGKTMVFHGFRTCFSFSYLVLLYASSGKNIKKASPPPTHPGDTGRCFFRRSSCRSSSLHEEERETTRSQQDSHRSCSCFFWRLKRGEGRWKRKMFSISDLVYAFCF